MICITQKVVVEDVVIHPGTFYGMHIEYVKIPQLITI